MSSSLNTNDEIVILAGTRTPLGAFQGALSSLSAVELGAHAVRCVMERTSLLPDEVQKIFMGCVLPAGLGQAPARQVAVQAGLDLACEATTINKVCGSGMQAIIMAYDTLRAGTLDGLGGDENVVIAGGMESMTNAPYLLPQARSGARMGDSKMIDSMMYDGLINPADGRSMGMFADDIAARYQFSREAQDAYALASIERARAASETGAFDEEICPIMSKGRIAALVEKDEGPLRAKPEKLPHLKPAFNANGTVTAANASSINDGAAALIVARRSWQEGKGHKAIARIKAHAAHAHDAEYFTTAPVPAMQKCLKKAGWSVEDVDLWEINEAFAVVPMIAMHEMGMNHERVNVNGGACVLGHPIGASGARIVVSLISALRARGLKRGMASLCIGGGEATALAIEIIA